MIPTTKIPIWIKSEYVTMCITSSLQDRRRLSEAWPPPAKGGANRRQSSAWGYYSILCWNWQDVGRPSPPLRGTSPGGGGKGDGGTDRHVGLCPPYPFCPFGTFPLDKGNRPRNDRDEAGLGSPCGGAGTAAAVTERAGGRGGPPLRDGTEVVCRGRCPQRPLAVGRMRTSAPTGLCNKVTPMLHLCYICFGTLDFGFGVW